MLLELVNYCVCVISKQFIGFGTGAHAHPPCRVAARASGAACRRALRALRSHVDVHRHALHHARRSASRHHHRGRSVRSERSDCGAVGGEQERPVKLEIKQNLF